VAAVLSGDAVLLKHSDRTPLCADHFQQAFTAAGAPKGLVQAIHVDHDMVAQLARHPSISFVSFTGSVAGGKAVYTNVAQHRFIDVGLELGGKDAAYVADDADMKHAIANVVDGSLYNAGQSCCAVERIYVHRSRYEEFLAGSKQLLSTYVLGDPLQPTTTLGPIAQPKQIDLLKTQVDQAVSKGARLLFGGKPTTDNAGKGRFFEPTLIADCRHDMSIMWDESFGPIVAVAPVDSDQDAIEKINDSPYGLTASVWTQSVQRADTINKQLNVGTVYMNRCYYLDPYLPWSGRQDSGKGISLSKYSFSPYYRTKGYNYRTQTN